MGQDLTRTDLRVISCSRFPLELYMNTLISAGLPKIMATGWIAMGRKI